MFHFVPNLPSTKIKMLKFSTIQEKSRAGVAKKNPERGLEMTWESSSSTWESGNLCESAAELSCGLLLPAPPAWCLQAAFETGVANYHESGNFCNYDPIALGDLSTSACEGPPMKQSAFHLFDRGDKSFADRVEKSNSFHGCMGSCVGNDQSSMRSPTQDVATFSESRDSDSSDSTIAASSIVAVHAEWKEVILTPTPRTKAPILKAPCVIPNTRPDVLAEKIKLVKASVVAPKRPYVSISEISNAGKCS